MSLQHPLPTSASADHLEVPLDNHHHHHHPLHNHSHVHSDDVDAEAEEAVEELVSSGSFSSVTTYKEITNEEGKSLGEKNINTFYSFLFIINQIYGPGVLAIPLVFQQSGWLPTFFFVFFFLVISSYAALCVSQAIALIPHNSNYTQRIEFGTAFKYYYGHKWSKAFQVLLNITLQSYLIASVVVCAQSVDQFLTSVNGRTYGLQLYPKQGFFAFDDMDKLYTDSNVSITLGYLIITAIFMPPGFQNLGDNVKSVQLASFIFLVVLLGEMVIYFIYKGAQDGTTTIPAFAGYYPQLVSVFIFSWAYVIFVPSWLNEKAPEVSVKKVIWSAGISSFIGYVAIGWLCAAVYAAVGLDNFLTKLSQAPTPIVTRVTSYLFSLGVIAPGIPVCAVTTRYNLFVGEVCGKKMSYFWGAVAPWLVGFLFSSGQIFAQLLTWTSLICNGFVNFVIPFLMYYTACTRVAKGIQHPHGDHHTHSSACATDGHKNDLKVSLLGADASLDSSSYPASPIRDGSVPLHRVLHDGSLSAHSACSPLVTGDEIHAPVYVYPKMLRRYSIQATIFLIGITVFVILGQIVLDLYYLLGEHKQPLD